MDHRMTWALAAVGVLALAGCSSATADGPAATTSPAVSDGGDDSAGVAPGRQAPDDERGGGVSGLVAAITGTTMQVQSTDMQTAVTWSDATTISTQVTIDLASVTVGSCVVVRMDDIGTSVSGDGSDGTGTAGAALGAAVSVAVSQPVDGQCATGAFGGGLPAGGVPGEMPTDVPSGGGDRPDPGGMPTDGAMPSGMPTDGAMPSGMPTDGAMPSGMPTDGAMPGGSAFGAVVAGLVSAVGGGSLTVDQDGTLTEVAVADSTTVTTSAAADASAIVAGLCVTARGEADDRGGLAATSLSLSDPVDGECTSAGGRGA